MSNCINLKAINYSPLDKINTILLSSPGTETVFGLSMPPEVSLFESSTLDLCDAITVRADHERMQNAFAKRRINVINMRNIIGGELEKFQTVFSNKNELLIELENRLYFLFQAYHLRDFNKSITEVKILLDKDIVEMGEGPAIAVNAVLNNCIKNDGTYNAFDIKQPSAANFMYWRDTNHIIGNEMRTHTMHFPIRQKEVGLAEIGLKSIGLEFERISLKNGSIEGGDIFPVETKENRYVLIGSAERTSKEGVEGWFNTHNKLWQTSGIGLTPVVIEGPNRNTQDFMHLDTFSQQISLNAFIHCGEITKNCKLSTLTKKNGKIKKVDSITYADWIEKNFRNVYNMSRTEQLNYAPNVVVDRDVVYSTRDGTPSVTKFIKNNCRELVELKMNTLTKLYGGAHCATSELRF